jgi:hypothetical protein
LDDPLSGESCGEPRASEGGHTPSNARLSPSQRMIDLNGQATLAESQQPVASCALHAAQTKQLNTLGLVCLIFFLVSGGPVCSCLHYAFLASRHRACYSHSECIQFQSVKLPAVPMICGPICAVWQRRSCPGRWTTASIAGLHVAAFHLERSGSTRLCGACYILS